MGRFPERFEIFWGLYPARQGKKLGKGQAYKMFQLLSEEDQVLCCRAAGVYGEFYKQTRNPKVFVPEPRDPIRFLRHDWWRDWLTPQEVAPQPCQFRSITYPCHDMAEPGGTHCTKHRLFLEKQRKRIEEREHGH